ncbi:hypothetical protein QQX98_001363 [Neonectria punicea]|uniref:Uncharacterized protein n=1 Tax=Neonectria punicea TaxID=979145 RepID=A0ABR1HNP9_9HYPO
MLTMSPIILGLSLLAAVAYGVLYLLFTTLTEVFETRYGIITNVGLVYFGIGVGQIVGVIAFGSVSDTVVKKLANGGEMKPEYRLPVMIPGAAMIPLGLLLYGWTAQYYVHWFVPILGNFFVGVGVITVFIPVAAYVVDAYPVHAASATAATTVLRSIGGALLPLAGPRMLASSRDTPELASSDGNLIPIFRKWAKTYGDIVQFSILGEKHVVLSSDKIAHELFVKRGSKYSDRGTPYAMKYVTQDLNPALMPKNEAWRRERKFLHSAVSITANDKYLKLMEEEARITLRDLVQDPGDFDNHMKRYSFGVLTRSMLGFRVGSADHPFITDTNNFIDETMKCFRPDEHPTNVLPFLRSFPTWLVPSLWEPWNAS